MDETPSGQDKTENKSIREREQYWHGHYKRWQKSGLSLAGYARSKGLVVNTFYDWHDRLKKRGLAKPEPATPVFHRVTARSTEPPPFVVEEVVPFRFQLPNGIRSETDLKPDNVLIFLDRLSKLRP